MAREIQLDTDDQQQVENSDVESYLSDAESCISDASDDDGNDTKLFDDGMIRLNEDDTSFCIIKHKFLSSLRYIENIDTAIEAIHKVNWLKPRQRKARFQSFHVYQHVLVQRQYEEEEEEDDDDDDDDVIYCTDYAWFCDSKQGIQNININGFGYRELIPFIGIRLSPMNSLLQSLENCVDDDDGFKHILLCKVLIDSKEVASETFTNQYVVPETKMNTHILPAYVVTFRVTQSLQGFPQAQHTSRKPASPWLPFVTLVSVLSQFLPPDTMRRIIESHKNFKDGNLSRQDWINKLRKLAGTDLLIHAINSLGFNKEKQKPVRVYPRMGKRVNA